MNNKIIFATIACILLIGAAPVFAQHPLETPKKFDPEELKEAMTRKFIENQIPVSEANIIGTNYELVKNDPKFGKIIGNTVPDKKQIIRKGGIYTDSKGNKFNNVECTEYNECGSAFSLEIVSLGLEWWRQGTTITCKGGGIQGDGISVIRDYSNPKKVSSAAVDWRYSRADACELSCGASPRCDGAEKPTDPKQPCAIRCLHPDDKNNAKYINQQKAIEYQAEKARQ
ncbi:MAG: hypothetical protein HZB65_03980 [Candidatus Aenigmarchaeota archaeon]|nr:hypothetical protein [Candidatus Aenigmarchaeota archaeon]